ncbi:Golgi-associated plant pathogenesis-related protein 1-like isoform X2 [Montipora capricornis]|uniref:Golgi-associated plant pathogenesis-related protein 1-like isoform X2 n=1 Tax=Montipora foliosa TaxID=591990 RepID=UPI0035F13671
MASNTMKVMLVVLMFASVYGGRVSKSIAPPAEPPADYWAMAKRGMRPTAPPKPRLLEVNIRECLGAHNAKRILHGAGPLSWNETLAKKARDWAIHLANEDKMEHAPWSVRKAGENLYYEATSSGNHSTCKDALEAWYSEVSIYPFEHPPNSLSDVTGGQIGHFTQVVWKSTKKLGVGIASIKRGFWTKTYVVARYTPPGNYYGQFKEQVGNSNLALK